MSVIVGDLAVRSDFGASNDFAQGRGVHTITTSAGSTFTYVGFAAGTNGPLSDPVRIFATDSSGALVEQASLTEDDIEAAGLDGGNFTQFGTPLNFTSATLDTGETFLYLSSVALDVITTLRVETDGNLTPITSTSSTGGIVSAAPGRLSVAETLNGEQFVIAHASIDEAGISSFRIQSDGTLQLAGRAAAPFGGNIDESLAVNLDSGSFVYLPNFGSDAVPNSGALTWYELSETGEFTNETNLEIEDIRFDGHLETANVAGTQYIFAPGLEDSVASIHVYAVELSSGAPSYVDSFATGIGDSVAGISALEIAGETFLAASTPNGGSLPGPDGGVLVFHVAPDGTLSDVTETFDDGLTHIARSSFNSFSNIDGTPVVVASSTQPQDNGLSSFELGGGDDALDGTQEDDLIFGFGGDDTLNGFEGNDLLNGGQGADTLDGGAGVDTVSYAESTSGVTVNLDTNIVSGGDAQGDTIANFENVAGSGANDTLTGDANVNAVSYYAATGGVTVDLSLLGAKIPSAPGSTHFPALRT